MFRDFDMDVVPERIFEEILTSVLDLAFLSLAEQQKKPLFAALSRKDVSTILSTGPEWKVYNISAVTCCLQVPFLKRILIPSPRSGVMVLYQVNDQLQNAYTELLCKGQK